jgi:hypothetical protein
MAFILQQFEAWRISGNFPSLRLASVTRMKNAHSDTNGNLRLIRMLLVNDNNPASTVTGDSSFLSRR